MSVLANPAWNGLPVTPSDSADLPVQPTRAFYVGGAGDVKVTFANGGATTTFVAVPVGTFLPLQVTKIFSTGTTASNIVALY